MKQISCRGLLLTQSMLMTYMDFSNIAPKVKKITLKKKDGKYYKKLDEMKFRGCSYILMAFANGQDCIQQLECHRFKLEWGCYEILTRHYTDSLGCVLNLANKCPLLKKHVTKQKKKKMLKIEIRRVRKQPKSVEAIF